MWETREKYAIVQRDGTRKCKTIIVAARELVLSSENAYNAQNANQNMKPWKTDGHTNTSFMCQPATDSWFM